MYKLSATLLIVAVFVIIGLIIALIATNSELTATRKELVKLTSGPGKYFVTITKANLFEADWTKDSAGKPKDIQMIIFKDGQTVVTYNLKGTRGIHIPSGKLVVNNAPSGEEVSPITFEMEYSLTSAYVIKWNELPAAPDSFSYATGEYNEPGYWLFNGRVNIQKGSWIEFTARKMD